MQRELLELLVIVCGKTHVESVLDDALYLRCRAGRESLTIIRGQIVEESLRRGAGVSGAEVCVEVEDCGPGDPEDQQGKVLDPFYQIRNDDGRSGGLGLGLAICQKIVEAHSGHLEIGKGDRGGAMVTVSLPIQN